MARTCQSGWELETTGTIEWSTSSGTISISTAKPLIGGRASMRSNPTAGIGYMGSECFSTTVSAVRQFWQRCYVLVDTFPAGLTTIVKLLDQSLTAIFSIRLNSNGTLELWNNVSNVQLGSDSTIQIGQGTPHVLEWSMVTNGSNQVAELYVWVKESLEISATGLTINYASGGSNTWQCRLGVQDTATADIYFDHFASNNENGAVANSRVGRGFIVHLLPVANGDVSNGTRGGSDTGSNWGQVAEVTPDDLSTYINLPNNGDTLDVKLEDPVTRGIPPDASILGVSVGYRWRGATASGIGMNIRVRSAAGGTAVQTSATTYTGTAFRTNFSQIFNTPYAYTDPTTGLPWTVRGTNSLTNAQASLVATDANPDIWITAVWLAVEYDPVPNRRFVNVNQAVTRAAVY